MKRADARAKLIERFLRFRGPVTLRDVLSHYGLPGKQVASTLEQLKDADLVVDGHFLPDKPVPQYCWKANLEELHRKSLARLKKEIEPVSVEQYVDFVLRWQCVHPDARLRGTDGLRTVLRRTQLHEDLIRLWERDFLPARVADYAPEMLDELIEAGDLIWGAFNFRFTDAVQGKPGTEGHGLQLCLSESRECTVDIPWTGPDSLDGNWEPECSAVRDLLARNGHMNVAEMSALLNQEPAFVTCLVWHLVWAGEVTAIDFAPLHHCDFARKLRSPLVHERKQDWERIVRRQEARGIRGDVGIWRLVSPDLGTDGGEPDWESLAEKRARLILEQYGIMSASFTKLFDEAIPKAEFRNALKRLVLKGEAVEGTFVRDVPGRQYALPEAIEALRSVQLDEGNGPVIMLNHHDPANLFRRGLDAYDEDGDKVTFGRPGRWYLFLQDGKMIAQMYGTDSGRGHYAILYFRFIFDKYRDLTRKTLETIVEHVRGRMPAAGYNELRIPCEWDGLNPRGRTFWPHFMELGFQENERYISLTLE